MHYFGFATYSFGKCATNDYWFCIERDSRSILNTYEASMLQVFCGIEKLLIVILDDFYFSGDRPVPRFHIRMTHPRSSRLYMAPWLHQLYYSTKYFVLRMI